MATTSSTELDADAFSRSAFPTTGRNAGRKTGREVGGQAGGETAGNTG
jgi:hypothetical protein